MVSKTSAPEVVGRDTDWAGRRIDHASFSTALMARRAELGNPELARNAGNRRTESKKALLAAIEAAGGKW
jgi:hypothetical protein